MRFAHGEGPKCLKGMCVLLWQSPCSCLVHSQRRDEALFKSPLRRNGAELGLSRFCDFSPFEFQQKYSAFDARPGYFFLDVHTAQWTIHSVAVRSETFPETMQRALRERSVCPREGIVTQAPCNLSSLALPAVPSIREVLANHRLEFRQ